MAKKPMFTKSNPLVASKMVKAALNRVGSLSGKEDAFTEFMDKFERPASKVSGTGGSGLKGRPELGPNEDEEALRAAAAAAGVNLKSGGPVTKKKSGGSMKKGYAKGGMVCRGMGAASRGGKFSIK